MKFTARQARVLAALDRVEGRVTPRGHHRFFLHGEDLSATVAALVVKGVIVTFETRGKLWLARPETPPTPPREG